jgi:aspartyl protease family protein
MQKSKQNMYNPLNYKSGSIINPMIQKPIINAMQHERPDLASNKGNMNYWVIIPVFLLVPLLMYVFLPTTSGTSRIFELWTYVTEDQDDEPCDRIKILKRCNDLILGDKSRSCMRLGEQFFQQCGDYDQLHRYINTAARRISEWTQAIASADTLIERYPYNADFRWMRGQTYEEKGDLSLALPDYEQTLDLLPEAVQPPFHLVNIYQRLNRPCDGVRPLEQFVFFHPNNASTANRQLAELYRNPVCSSLQGTGSANIRIRKGGASIRSSALINNLRKGEFVIDTGASFVVLSNTFANQLNIPYRNWPVRLTQTANGIAQGYFGYIDQITIQGIKARRIEAMVSENLGNIDGLLGLSFLSRFDIHMNASEGFIQLSQKSQPQTLGKGKNAL